MTARLAAETYAGLAAVLGETADLVCWHGHDRARYGITPSGRRYCADCRLETRMSDYYARRDARQCPRCGEPGPSGYVYCAPCRAYARDYARALRGRPC